MDMVVDANIIFSALIKKGTNYSLLFREEFQFFTPEYIILEI